MSAMKFTCGACGTTVTELWTLESLHGVMRLHAEHCPAVEIAKSSAAVPESSE